MKAGKWICWGIAALAAAGAWGNGALPHEDARVKRALEEEGLKYSIDQDWDFVLSYEGAEGDRTHLVVVNSRTERLGGSEIREVHGVAYLGKPLEKARLEELLEANASYILGAWEVSPVKTDADNARVQQVRFCIRLAANAPSELLRAAVESVADICDRKEMEWTGEDEW
jgi:hypothetical protein